MLVAVGGVPVVAAPGLANPFSSPKFTLLALTVIVGGTAAVVDRVRGRASGRWPWVGLPAVALVAVTALAASFGPAPLVSWVGREGRFAGAVSLVLLVGLSALIVLHCRRRPMRLRVLAAVSCASAGVDALYVVVQRAGVDAAWPLLPEAGGAFGSMGNTDFSGTHLAFATPLLLLFGRSDGRAWVRRLAIAGVLATPVLLAVLTARGAFVGWLWGLAAASYLMAPPMRWWVRRALLAAAVTAAAVVASLVVTGTSQLPGPWGPVGNDASTLIDRSRYWEGAVRLVAADPLLGIGPERFRTRYPSVTPTSATSRQTAATDPHDVLLERAVGAGVVALALYLVIVAMTMRSAWRARGDTEGAEAPVVGAFGSAFAAYLVAGLTGIDALQLAVLGWIAVAAVAAGADERLVRARRAPEPAASSVQHGLGRGVATVVVVAVGAVLAVQAIRPLVGDALVGSALVRVDRVRGDDEVAALVDTIDRAVAWNPASVAVLRQGAEGELRLVRTSRPLSPSARAAAADAAARHAADASELDPDDLYTLVTLAAAHRAQGDASGVGARFAEAEEALDRAAALDPRNPLVPLERARLWADRADHGGGDRDRERAAAVLAAIEPDQLDGEADSWWSVAQIEDQIGRRSDAIAAARRALQLEPRLAAPRRYLEALGERP